MKRRSFSVRSMKLESRGLKADKEEGRVPEYVA
jgi:hypothetical protein